MHRKRRAIEIVCFLLQILLACIAFVFAEEIKPQETGVAAADYQTVSEHGYYGYYGPRYGGYYGYPSPYGRTVHGYR